MIFDKYSFKVPTFKSIDLSEMDPHFQHFGLTSVLVSLATICNSGDQLAQEQASMGGDIEI